MEAELSPVRALYRYLSVTRKPYLAAIEKLGWSAATKDRGASYPSLVDVMAHTMDAHRWWFVFVLDDKPDDWTPPAPERKASFAALRAYEKDIDEIVSRRVERAESSRRHAIVDDDGKRSEWSETEILLHMIEEELQHRGEINCMMWQDDVDPPVAGYDDWILANR